MYNPATGELLCEVEEADAVSTLYINSELEMLFTSVLARVRKGRWINFIALCFAFATGVSESVKQIVKPFEANL